jgi:hypothetical protein
MKRKVLGYHTFDAARDWAHQQGFDNIAETNYRTTEEADVELAATLEKYGKICRPGFGMLCRSFNGAEELSCA